MSEKCPVPSPTNTTTVTRFLIQHLHARRGYATTDYYIDLINEKHGLYDLVSTVYDTLRKENLTDDNINSHLWNVHFAGIRYKNGWRHCNIFDGMSYDRPAGKYDIDEGERRIFSSLATPLEKGQRGVCKGESASFDILVQSTSLTEDQEKDPKDEKKEEASLQLTPIVLTLSGFVEDDWISAAKKTECVTLQHSWDHYFRGENTWKKDRRTRNFIPCKPLSPQWDNDEMTIIGLLLNSDAKFKKSWTNVLQYAFVNRKESAASMKWYQLKGKDSYKIEHRGRGMTDDARIRLAKRLAKKRMMSLLERGCPTRETNPDDVVETKLRKRGLIDDGTSETVKKILCIQHRYDDDDSSESSFDDM
jgi:hypothetical protein